MQHSPSTTDYNDVNWVTERLEATRTKFKRYYRILKGYVAVKGDMEGNIFQKR